MPKDTKSPTFELFDGCKTTVGQRLQSPHRITAHITCMKLLVFYVFYGQTYILTAIIHIQIIFIYCFGVIRWPTYGWHGMHV